MITWATSGIGLWTQAVAALVFQLVGVVLVVEDVRSARRELRALHSKFAQIDNEAKLAIKRYDREVYDEHGKIRRDAATEAVMAAPFMTLQEWLVAIDAKTDALAQHNDKHTGRGVMTWIGPACLLLGIVFSFTATVSTIQ